MPYDIVLRQCQSIQSEIKDFEAVKFGTQISKLKRENKEGLEEVLTLLITKLVNSCHTSQKMGSDQILDCVFDLIADKWYMKFEEIVLVLNNLRKQKNFNRLDQSVIYEGFTHYEENNRLQAIERAKIEVQTVSESQKNEEIKIIREKYADVIAGKSKFTIDLIAEERKEAAEKERNSNNEFINFKAKYFEKLKQKEEWQQK